MLRLQAVSGGAGGTQTNPKDEQNARLAERQRTLDMLNAELQLEQTEVSLMRQEGSLGRYLELALPRSTGQAAGSRAVPDAAIAAPALPATLGSEPVGTTPGGAPTAPGSVPTTGSTPPVLPSAPVTTPPPSAPPSTAPNNPHP